MICRKICSVNFLRTHTSLAIVQTRTNFTYLTSPLVFSKKAELNDDYIMFKAYCDKRRTTYLKHFWFVRQRKYLKFEKESTPLKFEHYLYRVLNWIPSVYLENMWLQVLFILKCFWLLNFHVYIFGTFDCICFTNKRLRTM